MATKYEIDTVSYVNTVLHTFSPTLFSEFTVGVNWAHQNTSPLDDAARDANNRRIVLPGMPQFFPEANPLDILPQATFTGGSPGTIASFGVEQRFPFFGYNTLFNVSGNITKIKGAHTIKDRPVRRAHDEAGRAHVELQRHLQLQQRRAEPAEYQCRFCQRVARRHHRVHGIRRASVGARAVLSHRMVRTGQLACATESHAGCGHPFLLHDADAESGRSGCGVRARELDERAGAETVPARIDAARTPCAQSADRRDPSSGLHRPACPELWELHQRHAGVPTARRRAPRHSVSLRVSRLPGT